MEQIDISATILDLTGTPNAFMDRRLVAGAVPDYNQHNNKSLLFNLQKDPNELNNIFEIESDVGQRLLSLIMDNFDKANKKIMEKNNASIA